MYDDDVYYHEYDDGDEQYDEQQDDEYNNIFLVQAGSLVDTNTIVWPWETEFINEVNIHNEIVEKFNGNFSWHHFNRITGRQIEIYFYYWL